MFEQFVEVKVLIDQEINAGCLTQEPWIWSVPGAGSWPNIEVVSSVLEAVSGLNIVKCTQSKLYQ